MATIAAPPVTKTTLDVGLLRDARALYSENPSHAPVGGMPFAGTHCAVTAISEFALDDGRLYRLAATSLACAAGLPGRGEIPQWNAEHTTEEVLEVWDRAIAALEAA